MPAFAGMLVSLLHDEKNRSPAMSELYSSRLLKLHRDSLGIFQIIRARCNKKNMLLPGKGFEYNRSWIECAAFVED